MLRNYDRAINAVVLDLAPHPIDAWAVVYHGKLLPTRFSTEEEAGLHLGDIVADDAKGKKPRSVAA